MFVYLCSASLTVCSHHHHTYDDGGLSSDAGDSDEDEDFTDAQEGTQISEKLPQLVINPISTSPATHRKCTDPYHYTTRVDMIPLLLVLDHWICRLPRRDHVSYVWCLFPDLLYDHRIGRSFDDGSYCRNHWPYIVSH
jgi:hypothetical protein